MKFFPKCILSITILISLSGCEKVNTELVMFRTNAQHSGTSTSLPVTEMPAVQWKFRTNGPINSSAAVTEKNIYFGSGDSSLYCLERETGKSLWEYKTAGAVHSSPAVANGMVYFGSLDGNFYALDAQDGSLKWKFETGGELYFSAPGIHGATPKDSVMVDLWDFYLSSPTIDKGTVYFGTGSGNVYALDASSGKQKWNFKTSGVVHSSPAVAFGNVYIGSWDTYLYALNAADGKEVWKFKTGIDTAYYNQTGIQGSPVIADSTLYFGCRDSHLYALNALSGQQLWKRFNGYSWVIATPVIHEEKLIYTTADMRSVVALDRITGDSLYQERMKGFIHSSPTLAGTYLYFGELTGSLTCADAATGKKVWTYQMEGAQKDEFGLLNPDSTLNFKVAFSREHAKKAGKDTYMDVIFSLGSVLASPILKDQVIYFGATDGYFYAMR